MLATEIGQLMQPVFLRKKFAEPMHGLVVPLLGTKTTLSIVPGDFVQLCDEGLIDSGI